MKKENTIAVLVQLDFFIEGNFSLYFNLFSFNFNNFFSWKEFRYSGYGPPHKWH